MRTLLFLVIFVLVLQSCSHNAPDQYDICIYGSTSAGVIAAYSAAQLGKKVLLVDPGKRLGGLTSGGLGYTDIGNKYAISGISRDFYRKVGKHYGKFEQWTFEPHVAEELFKKYADHKNITILAEHLLERVHKEGSEIKRAVFVHGNKQVRVTAKIFIDCTYEGDLMARAGVSYAIGRENNNEYGETWNGVQLLEGHQFPDGIDPYKKKGDSSSGLLWGISNAALKSNGSGDSSVQAYNFRICLTKDPLNKIQISRPAEYDSSRYELLLRLIDAQPTKRKLNDYFIISGMPNNKTDINNRGGFSSDMIGMNHHYPEAGYDERKKIFIDHEQYTKGLLYFIGNDPRVPEELRSEMKQWGYPRDEYVESGNWTPQMYVRESRRMKGAYVMTQHHCEGSEVATDTIGFAAYTMDSHNCQRLVVNGMVKNEGNVEVGGFGPYPISYRCVIPKAEECTNLYVPVCLSASHIAYGSIRMEPVFMVLAQSVGIAASIAIDNNQSVQQVDVKKLQEILKKDPLLDGSVPEVLVDNDDSVRVQSGAGWHKTSKEEERGYTGNYGPSMLICAEKNPSSTVVFRPQIPVEGHYQVYYYVPKIPEASTHIKLTLHDGRRDKKLSIATDSIVVEGQTSGEWASLGTFDFPQGNRASLTVYGSEDGRPVVADAVLLVHQK